MKLITPCLLFLLALDFPFVLGEEGEQKSATNEAQEPVVRELILANDELAPNFYGLWGGRDEITTLDTLEALAEVVGAATAQKMTKGLDWEKEQVVLVSWSTGGPPDGTLAFESQANKEDGEDEEAAKNLLFYVQGPAGNDPRGMRFSMMASFFAVARDLPMSLEKGERLGADAPQGQVEGGGKPQAAPGVEFRELELDMPKLEE